jgi:hypothetical protein
MEKVSNQVSISVVIGIETVGPRPYGMQTFELRPGMGKDVYPYMCPNCQRGLKFTKKWIGKHKRIECNVCKYPMFLYCDVLRFEYNLP